MKKYALLLITLIFLSTLTGCGQIQLQTSATINTEQTSSEESTIFTSAEETTETTAAIQTAAIRTTAVTTQTEIPKQLYDFYNSFIIHTRSRVGYGTMSPYAIVISSKEELDEYIENNKNSFTFDESWYGDTFFEVIAVYDEEYFASKNLVFAVLQSPSGSYRYTVNYIEKTETGCIINLKEIRPSLITHDMARWHVFIETDKIINNSMEIGIVIEH